ncbi:MAG: hypothetical protein KKF41_13065 [Actinobacteria bacterium]|nr:hypothetical protein [Actinomycetota bacterium]MBU1944011.1 hypothetical protein [Actinomycetota bacterium]MBU2688507.1 hypothetical protein [Actinomycetota bacterium]
MRTTGESGRARLFKGLFAGLSVVLAIALVLGVGPIGGIAHAVENPGAGGWGAEYGVDYPGGSGSDAVGAGLKAVVVCSIDFACSTVWLCAEFADEHISEGGSLDCKTAVEEFAKELEKAMEPVPDGECTDVDGNGIDDSTQDMNNDGTPDAQQDLNGDGTPDGQQDTDGDGKKDHVDDDDDNDGYKDWEDEYPTDENRHQPNPANEGVDMKELPQRVVQQMNKREMTVEEKAKVIVDAIGRLPSSGGNGSVERALLAEFRRGPEGFELTKLYIMNRGSDPRGDIFNGSGAPKPTETRSEGPLSEHEKKQLENFLKVFEISIRDQLPSVAKPVPDKPGKASGKVTSAGTVKR